MVPITQTKTESQPQRYLWALQKALATTVTRRASGTEQRDQCRLSRGLLNVAKAQLHHHRHYHSQHQHRCHCHHFYSSFSFSAKSSGRLYRPHTLLAGRETSVEGREGVL
ncbi:hypothetical protein E2C01_005752 [Portunus trituberculatus]|uniref:Uncharacterized protein n=1 Tax=Portunus trituberculatus TaxID=210409 RepID=A0A5B7CWA9_PORTR|nr:hypothetical protein [Portunus trituberculatus]